MFAGWLRGDILAFVNCVLDTAILLLLVIWMIMDRNNIYISDWVLKDKLTGKKDKDERPN